MKKRTIFAIIFILLSFYSIYTISIVSAKKATSLDYKEFEQVAREVYEVYVKDHTLYETPEGIIVKTSLDSIMVRKEGKYGSGIAYMENHTWVKYENVSEEDVIKSVSLKRALWISILETTIMLVIVVVKKKRKKNNGRKRDVK